MRKVADRAMGVAIFGLAIGATPSMACGPDFPSALLTQKDVSIRLPERPFHDGLKRLHSLPESRFPWVDSGDLEIALEQADEAALERWFERRGEADPELRIELLTARRLMRMPRADPAAGDDGSTSERAPVDIPRRLPAELRLYLEGADAYRRQDLETAVERWLTLLELEENDRRERSVMAHYMLGRTYARLAGFDG
ncbi:MAG: hypothetical protein AAGM22_14405, partial [Acidobacteriota bacterium]